MVSLRKVDSDGVFYKIPSGDPDQEYSLEASRRLIGRNAYKGADPWFRLVTLLKPSVGHKPPLELVKSKEIEQIFARCHRIMDEVPKQVEILEKKESSTPREKTAFDACDRNMAKGFLDRRDESGSLHLLLGLADPTGYMHHHLHAFLKSKYENFGDYFEEFSTQRFRDKQLLDGHLKPKNQGMIDLLKAFQVDPEELYGRDQSLDPEKYSAYPGSWKKLSIQNKYTVLQSFVRRLSIAKQGLNVSEWRPHHGINQLIKELQKRGPLGVNASLGCNVYKSPPDKMKQKIGDCDIYYWPKGSEYREHCNAILIVGALPSGLVLYVDSTDACDPKEEPIIYGVSYETLANRIFDLEAVQRKKSPLGFAVYA